MIVSFSFLYILVFFQAILGAFQLLRGISSTSGPGKGLEDPGGGRDRHAGADREGESQAL